jgi:hypothetical protein
MADMVDCRCSCTIRTASCSPLSSAVVELLRILEVVSSSSNSTQLKIISGSSELLFRKKERDFSDRRSSDPSQTVRTSPAPFPNCREGMASVCCLHDRHGPGDTECRCLPSEQVLSTQIRPFMHMIFPTERNWRQRWSGPDLSVRT